MSSTGEYLRQYSEAKEKLGRSGQEDILKDRVRSRINLIADSVVGRKTFRNLWGLRPVREQELFHWNDGGGLFPESTFIAGKHLDIYSELGELGEEIVGGVLNEFGKYELVSDTEEGHRTPTIITTELYKSPVGVEFRRIAYRINRRVSYDDPHEEWVPGFPATHDIFWHVVFPQ